MAPPPDTAIRGWPPGKLRRRLNIHRQRQSQIVIEVSVTAHGQSSSIVHNDINPPSASCAACGNCSHTKGHTNRQAGGLLRVYRDITIRYGNASPLLHQPLYNGLPIPPAALSPKLRQQIRIFRTNHCRPPPPACRAMLSRSGREDSSITEK